MAKVVACLVSGSCLVDCFDVTPVARLVQGPAESVSKVRLLIFTPFSFSEVNSL